MGSYLNELLKHVVKSSDFKGLGITTQDEIFDIIQDMTTGVADMNMKLKLITSNSSNFDEYIHNVFPKGTVNNIGEFDFFLEVCHKTNFLFNLVFENGSHKIEFGSVRLDNKMHRRKILIPKEIMDQYNIRQAKNGGYEFSKIQINVDKFINKNKQLDNEIDNL